MDVKFLSNDKLIEIGHYKEEYNTNLNIKLPILKIVQSSGLEVHIKKKHPGEEKYLSKVTEILNHPDYIGSNPREPNSIELAKVYADNVLLAIKLDTSKNYYYIASLYSITEGKLNNRLKSGRLKKFT